MATPALLQRTWTPPKALHACSASAWTESSLRTSVLTVTALTPAFSAPAAVSAMPVSSRSATTTLAPSPANARQSARPIPLAPPVTTATLPLRFSPRCPLVLSALASPLEASVSARTATLSPDGGGGNHRPRGEGMSSVAVPRLVLSAAMDYRLPTTVVPKRYDLRLEPDLAAATFAGEAVITVEVETTLTEITLNA